MRNAEQALVVSLVCVRRYHLRNVEQMTTVDAENSVNLDSVFRIKGVPGTTSVRLDKFVKIVSAFLIRPFVGLMTTVG